MAALQPFHWDAEFEELDPLLAEVMVTRMGLAQRLSDEQVTSLVLGSDAGKAHHGRVEDARLPELLAYLGSL